MAETVLIFGVLSIFVWPIHYIGFLISILGLSAGIFLLRRRKNGMLIAGIIFAGIGLVLTAIDLKIGLLDIILKTYFQY